MPPPFLKENNKALFLRDEALRVHLNKFFKAITKVKNVKKASSVGLEVIRYCDTIVNETNRILRYELLLDGRD